MYPKDQEVKERLEKAYYANQHQAGCASETIGADVAGSRESLRGRLERELYTAQRNARRVDQLSELIALLDRNPEVARILDLIDALGMR